MKRKFTGIFLCLLLMCTTVLAGCNLVSRDMTKYYNTEVARIESKENPNEYISITKRDLITAYNSYGYYYESYYGQSRAQALRTTIDLLVNRKLTISMAEELYGDLSEAEKTYLWTETVNALRENFNSYVDEVLGTSSSTGDETSEDQITFEGYSPNAHLEEQNGSIVVVKDSVPSKIIESFKYDTPRDFDNQEDKNKIYTDFVAFINSERSETYSEAFNDYYRALIRNEEGQNLSETRPEVFGREIERIYKVVYENYMISKYQEYYTSYEYTSNITASQIVDVYSSRVRSSYVEYEIEGSDSYDSDMQSGARDIYYYKTDADSTKFFNVAHILFQFTDEQQAEYETIVANKENGRYSTEEAYQAALDALYLKVKPIVREADVNGVYNEISDRETYEESAQALRDYIAGKVSAGVTDYEKADIFNEYIYKYNQDPGMFNAEYCYTIGVDANGDAVSSYVEEFTDAAIALYDNGNGQVGDISQLVYTENGIHVLFYAGEVTNLFDVNYSSSFALEEEAISTLASTRVNIMVNETYFDMIYDELVTDNYAVFENLQMNEIKQNYTINIYPNSYSDLVG